MVRELFKLALVVVLVAVAVIAVDVYTEGAISGALVLADNGDSQSGEVFGAPEEPAQSIGEEDVLKLSGSKGKGPGGGGPPGGGGGSPPGQPSNPPGQPSEPPEEMYFSLTESPTEKWMDVDGNLTIKGKPAQVGDEVAAFDPDGVICGIYRVKAEGMYGFLHIYGDDSLSPEDEGAKTGDTITFRVYDWSKDQELEADGSVSWSVNKQIIIDLTA